MIRQACVVPRKQGEGRGEGGRGICYVLMGVGTPNATFEAKQGGSTRFNDPRHGLVHQCNR
jgi:hypothetical protein